MELSQKIKIIERKRFVDDRGWFLKSLTGLEENLPEKTGEFYLTSGIPGKSKGAHYHRLAREWFTLVTGECWLRLRDMESEEEFEFLLSAKLPQTIFIPPLVAHVFENRGDNEFILAAYSSHIYDPSDTINFNFL